MVTETRFGVEVSDPFRALEEDSEATRTWTDAQNAATDAYFASCVGTTELRARVAELLEAGFCEMPLVTAKKRAFYTRRSGAAQQPKLVFQDRDGRERVLIDAEALTADATDAIDWWFASPGGTRVAWGRSSAGSEQSVLHVRNVETGEDLPDRIADTQHCMVAWASESSFYYSRYPAGVAYDCRVYFHELGKDPKDDPIVFGEGLGKTDSPLPMMSPCGRWLVISVQQGWSKSEIFLRDLHDPNGALVAIAAGEEAIFEPIVRRDALYVLTNSGAERYRLIAIDWENTGRDAWREILAEGSDVLTSVAVTSERVVATYLRDASSVLVVRDRNGEAHEVELPAIGSAAVTASPDDDDVYIGFTSFAVPLGVYKLRADGSAIDPWASVEHRASNVAVERRFAISKDGTRVPMFVVSGARSNGKTVLYGYGGFNVNQTPAFSARVLAFVERGGTWVSAVLRGGGEYGEAWHRAGMLEKKQNVFDDYYACAEDLASRGVAARSLASVGGSNGGLLVSAAITQRPELFGAGIALVPLTDMLRYHLFRLGAFWIKEYGSPDDAAEFNVLYKYSPVHHVKAGARYPAMLFWAAESDSRVDPMHARKMAAALQAASASEKPVLLRVETRAGHGMGKPTGKVADQLAVELAFLERELSA